MRPVLCLTAAVALLTACAVAPSESSTAAEVVISNRIIANRIIANRIIANRIIANRLSAHRMTVNMNTAGELLKTDDGREVFSLIVGCALADDVTLTATVDGTDFEFFGELGLAPQWLHDRLDRVGQGWVSACMFSRVNGHQVAIPISLRGPSQALDVSDDEREEWSLQEGAFFGNFFGRLDRPLQWFACRGRDLAKGEAGSLAERDCAKPDPANPGFTLCGMAFAGDCGSFAADPVCESFSKHGTFYRQCHTAPIQHHRGHGRHDRDARDPDEDFDEAVASSDARGVRVFDQVITTFVTP